MQPHGALFLSLMVINCSGERSFSRLKRIKNELRAAIFQERLFTLSIRYIKSDKLGQTNCDEFLDNFVMKKAGQNLLLFTVLCSALLDLMIVAFYFFIRTSIMTA